MGTPSREFVSEIYTKRLTNLRKQGAGHWQINANAFLHGFCVYLLSATCHHLFTTALVCVLVVVSTPVMACVIIVVSTSLISCSLLLAFKTAPVGKKHMFVRLEPNNASPLGLAIKELHLVARSTCLYVWNETMSDRWAWTSKSCT